MNASRSASHVKTKHCGSDQKNKTERVVFFSLTVQNYCNAGITQRKRALFSSESARSEAKASLNSLKTPAIRKKSSTFAQFYAPAALFPKNGKNILPHRLKGVHLLGHDKET